MKSELGTIANLEKTIKVGISKPCQKDIGILYKYNLTYLQAFLANMVDFNVNNSNCGLELPKNSFLLLKENLI